jgi:flagellar FliL protein
MAEEKDSKSETAGRGSKKSKKKLILFGLSVLILAASGGFLWKSGLAMKFIGGEQKSEQQGSKTPGDGGKKIGPLYPLESFIVNLNDATGRRYLKVKAEMELTDAKAVEVVDKQLPRLRDSIILLLSSKSFEEIASREGKMRLRQEMIGQLNHHLGKGKLVTVYFTEFVVQ